MSVYKYSVSGDIASGKLDVYTLQIQIESSGITVTPKHIRRKGDDLSIVFPGDLSAGDKTLLDSVVSSHSGTPQTRSSVIEVNGVKYRAADVKPGAGGFTITWEALP